MPIYEYACQKCGNVVEVFQKVNDKGPGKCPKCGGKLARVLSQTSFQLKGGGWYKDLYASTKPGTDTGGGSASADLASKSDSKSEATPEAKREATPATPAASASKDKPSKPSKSKKKAS